MGETWQPTKAGKSDGLFQVFCHADMTHRYPYKMIQIEDRYCALLVARHCSAKTKASVQGSR